MIDVALIELLERVGAVHGKPVYFNEQELNKWSVDFVTAIKSSGLITQAAPAKSTVCPGCEQACAMPIIILNKENTSKAFVFCDKRNDVNRILIPLEALEQWQASAYSIANLLSRLLELPSSPANTNSNRWELGVLKGKKHSSHLVLLFDQKLILTVAGHSLSIDELLSFEKDLLKIDRHKITRAIDNPVTGSGDVESANDRQQRLQQRVGHFKMKGHKNFIKLVAEEENITTGRLHQILNRK